MDVDTRRLRTFLVVAQELHFSRAAKQLHISQPALSQQVRALERELKAELFVRTSRQVQLTLAGQALLDAAPRALYEFDRAIESAQQAAAGNAGTLVIGSVRSGLSSVLPSVMRAFTAEHPKVRFEVIHMDTALQLRALIDRRIDVGIVRAAPPTDSLVIEPLISEPLMLAVPADHPLASLDSIDPTLLADEPFVSWPRHLGVDFFDIVIAFCREHGFSPNVNTEGGDIDSQLALVGAGFGVSLQPAFYADSCPVGVVFRPLDGSSPQVVLQMARRRDSPPVVGDFATVARGWRPLSEFGSHSAVATSAERTGWVCPTTVQLISSDTPSSARRTTSSDRDGGGPTSSARHRSREPPAKPMLGGSATRQRKAAVRKRHRERDGPSDSRWVSGSLVGNGKCG